MLPLAVHLTERYGPGWLKIIPVVRQMASRLNRIYELQRRGVAFETPAALLEALDLYNLTQVSAYDYFRRIGLPSQFIYEFIDGASRDNYNQDGSLNALADLVSLAGAGLAGDVFELQEAAQIPQRLLQGTEVRLNTSVEAAAPRASSIMRFSTPRAARRLSTQSLSPRPWKLRIYRYRRRWLPPTPQATCASLASGHLSREVFGARADDLDTV